MVKRHKITEGQWERIKDLVPPERSGGKGLSAKDNRMDNQCNNLDAKKRSTLVRFTGMVWFMEQCIKPILQNI